jgi:hypothetical protein
MKFKKTLKEFCLVAGVTLSSLAVSFFFITDSSHGTICIDVGPSGAFWIIAFISFLFSVLTFLVYGLYHFVRKVTFNVTSFSLLLLIFAFNGFNVVFDDLILLVENLLGDFGIFNFILISSVYLLLIFVIYELIISRLTPAPKSLRRGVKVFLILLLALCVGSMLFLDDVLCYEPFPRGYLFFFVLFSLVLSLIWFLFIRFLSPR